MNTIIIDTKEQAKLFFEEVKHSDMILHPIFINSELHPAMNDLAVISIYLISTDIMYIFTFNHLEYNIDLPMNKFFEFINLIQNKKYIYNKKNLLHIYFVNELIDVNLLYYFVNNHAYEEKNALPTNTFKLNSDFHYKELNKITPLVKLIEICERYTNIINDILQIKAVQEKIDDKSFQYYNTIVTENLYQLEQSGLFVNAESLENHFDSGSLNHVSDNNMMYTDYNLYTSTGRPSNCYGGINFAGLTKTDGSREFIQSRFENGNLIEFDFDAYHLSIIAKLINYDIPENMSMHEYLGRQYNGTTEQITAEQYNESKNISFKILYGGKTEEFKDIDFFDKTDTFIKKLWLEFKTNKYIVSPISEKKLYLKNYPDITDSKLFNYYLQLSETEFSSIIIQRFLNLITKYEYQSKFILYTYDSFLFDVHPEEKQFVIEILKILDEFGFKYKIKKGQLYSNMKSVTLKQK
jgi:hypothetical protein